jgi:hypothetical protein
MGSTRSGQPIQESPISPGSGAGAHGSAVSVPVSPWGDLQGDEDLASLKILELKDNEAWLVAANSAYAPIPLKEAAVLGRVTTIIRRF